MYTLYYSPGACSMAVHIVLEELGVPYTLQLVSVRSRDHEHPDYLKINPKGRVPALDVDGQILTEVGAILPYLANAHPRAGLLPVDPLARARVQELIAWLSSDVHAAYKQVWRAERFSIHEDDYPAIRAKGKVNVSSFIGDINTLLSDGRTYATGDLYTVADPYLLVYYGWARSVGIPLDQYPAFGTYVARLLKNRPVIAAVMQAEGLPLAA